MRKKATLTGSPTTLPPSVSPVRGVCQGFVVNSQGELTPSNREERDAQSTGTKPAERHILGVEFASNNGGLGHGESQQKDWKKKTENPLI